LPDIRVGDIRLHYEEWGSGPPLLLLHGFPFSLAIWSEVASRIGDAARVVAPDLRGHGRSDKPEGPYTMEVLAQDVLGLADALGLESFVLGGHSMGGYVAFRVAAHVPERLRGLVLVATRAEADTEEAKARRRAAVERIQREGKAPFLEEFLAGLVSDRTRTDRPQVLEQARAVAEAVPEHVLVACLDGMRERRDSRELLTRVGVPALVVVGGADRVTPPEAARSMAEALPQARLVTVPDAGHLPMLEAPEVTAASLRAFLGGLRA
jgi:3-oxoadipate enol-lactonase